MVLDGWQYSKPPSETSFQGGHFREKASLCGIKHIETKNNNKKQCQKQYEQKIVEKQAIKAATIYD